MLGAGLNVRINAKDLKDAAMREDYVSRAKAFAEQAVRAEAEILALVEATVTA